MNQTASQVFHDFLATFESRRACAEMLGCSYPLVCSLANGQRSVSKDIAARANQLRPQFSRDALLFGSGQSKAA